SKHLAKELGIEVSERHVNRLLKQMGLSTRRSRSLQQANEGKTSSKSNIVIRNLQGNKPPQAVSFSPFHFI
ncbi:MAG: helix-turn-helix domain-containing protein, partial [Pleurocapsa sp. MO_192.B19]|nr:helix-turn-helix domain-containing protein [Pleurocapsa sp. MO_192.B19]